MSFQIFQAELSIDFYGRVALDAQVSASATIAGNFIDLSGPIREKLLGAIQGKLPSFLGDPAAVKKGVFSFFANLMRLNEIAVRTRTRRSPAKSKIFPSTVDRWSHPTRLRRSTRTPLLEIRKGA